MAISPKDQDTIPVHVSRMANEVILSKDEHGRAATGITNGGTTISSG